MKLTEYMKAKVIRLRKAGLTYSRIEIVLNVQDNFSISSRNLRKLYNCFEKLGITSKKRKKAANKITEEHLDKLI